MKKKTILLIVSFLAAMPFSHAQKYGAYSKSNYGNGSSFGVNVLYDMQLRSSVNQGDVASNVGAALNISLPVNYAWGVMADLKLYGFAVKSHYDRCASVMADLLFWVNNAIRGEYCRGGVYLKTGAGITYAVDGTDGLGMVVNAGMGYTYWITKKIGVNANGSVDLIGFSKHITSNIGVGCVIRL